MQGFERGVLISGLGWILAGTITLSIWEIAVKKALSYTNPPGILALGVIGIISGLSIIIFKKQVSAFAERKIAASKAKSKYRIHKL